MTARTREVCYSGQIEGIDIEEGLLTVDYDGRIVEYAGLAAHKGVNLGAVGLGQATATAIAQQIAISNFLLGQTLGGFY